MRTTISLDDDVVAKLHEDMRQTGRSFTEAVNENLRAKLTVKTPAKAKKFVVRAKEMGPGPASSFVSGSELTEFLEGPTHR